MRYVEYIDWETIKLAIICLFMLFLIGVVLFTKWFESINPKNKRDA